MARMIASYGLVAMKRRWVPDWLHVETVAEQVRSARLGGDKVPNGNVAKHAREHGLIPPWPAAPVEEPMSEVKRYDIKRYGGVDLDDALVPSENGAVVKHADHEKELSAAKVVALQEALSAFAEEETPEAWSTRIEQRIAQLSKEKPGRTV